MNTKKSIMWAVVCFLAVVAMVAVGYWISGKPVVRGNDLLNAYIMAVSMGSIAACFGVLLGIE